jgi:hypothetical protein
MPPAHALSPRSMIGKEHRSVTPTHPTTWILTLRKVTTRCQLVVPSSSSDDNLSLVKHETRVDLNPSGARIRYTQEPDLVFHSPLPSPRCYIVLGQRVGVGYSKVLIPTLIIRERVTLSQPRPTRHRGCTDVVLPQRFTVYPK